MSDFIVRNQVVFILKTNLKLIIPFLQVFSHGFSSSHNFLLVNQSGWREMLLSAWYSEMLSHCSNPLVLPLVYHHAYT